MHFDFWPCWHDISSVSFLSHAGEGKIVDEVPKAEGLKRCGRGPRPCITEVARWVWHTDMTDFSTHYSKVVVCWQLDDPPPLLSAHFISLFCLCEKWRHSQNAATVAVAAGIEGRRSDIDDAYTTVDGAIMSRSRDAFYYVTELWATSSDWLTHNTRPARWRRLLVITWRCDTWLALVSASPMYVHLDDQYIHWYVVRPVLYRSVPMRSIAVAGPMWVHSRMAMWLWLYSVLLGDEIGYTFFNVNLQPIKPQIMMTGVTWP